MKATLARLLVISPLALGGVVAMPTSHTLAARLANPINCSPSASISPGSLNQNTSYYGWGVSMKGTWSRGNCTGGYNVAFNWNFGDGTNRSQLYSCSGTCSDSFTHTFPNNGTYNISLDVSCAGYDFCPDRTPTATYRLYNGCPPSCRYPTSAAPTSWLRLIGRMRVQGGVARFISPLHPVHA